MTKEYLLEPLFANRVVEREYWSDNKGRSFTMDQHYRWLELFVQCDTKPFVEIENENEGVNITEYLENKYPGCNLDNNIISCYDSVLVEFSDNICEDLLDKIKDFGNNRYDLEDDGWDYSHTELWVYTSMRVKE